MTQPLILQLDNYERGARGLVSAAQALCDERGHAEVEPLHLLYVLFASSKAVRQVATRASADADDVLVESELCLRRIRRGEKGVSYLSARLLDMLGRAEAEAARSGSGKVEELHLLLSLAQGAEGDARVVLSSCGLSAPVLRAALPTDAFTAGSAARTLERFGTDLTQQARAARLDPVVGRADELRRVITVLSRRYAHNPLLIGEHGVGRNSIVRALAQRIASGDVPAMLKDRRVLELHPGALVTGSKTRSESEERTREFLAAIQDEAGAVIVYARDATFLLGESSSPAVTLMLQKALREGSLRMIVAADAVAYRKHFLGSDVGAHFVVVPVEPATVDDTIAVLRGVVSGYESAHGLRISDPALMAAARFAKRYLPSAELPRSAIDVIDEAAARVRVAMQSAPAVLDRLTRELESTEVQLSSLSDDIDASSSRQRTELEVRRSTILPQLSALRDRWQGELEQRERIAALRRDLSAAERAVALSESAEAVAPEVSVAALGQQLAAAEEALARSEPLARGEVTEQDVADVIAERTGVPVAKMLEGDAEKLIHMEERLSERVIGQGVAVSAVSRAVRRSRVGLRDGKRPIGSFLFLGTSGVGKTELAKAVAEFLFDDEAALTRLDMSEFMEKHAVARLLGSPPGYVDSEEGGFLTEAVRRRPYSVILLDEVEKAHPDVFNIMLQVLDDGRLSDARGRIAHFADTVIILTSNLGSHHILGHDGDEAALQDRMMESLHAHFRPEFLNRIDEVVIFDTLSREDLGKILEIHLSSLQKRMAASDLTLQLSQDAKDHLVALSDEPAFGARPLRRTLQREIMDPLADALLADVGAHGPRVLSVTLQRGAIQMQVRSATAPEQ